jgi:hypothetical protein
MPGEECYLAAISMNVGTIQTASGGHAFAYCFTAHFPAKNFDLGVKICQVISKGVAGGLTPWTLTEGVIPAATQPMRSFMGVSPREKSNLSSNATDKLGGELSTTPRLEICAAGYSRTEVPTS